MNNLAIDYSIFNNNVNKNNLLNLNNNINTDTSDATSDETVSFKDIMTSIFNTDKYRRMNRKKTKVPYLKNKKRMRKRNRISKMSRKRNRKK